MGPDVGLKQSLGEDDTGLMTPDDADPELPMAAFATLWKDIPEDRQSQLRSKQN